MSTRRVHKDVEFHVDHPITGGTQVFKRLDEACLEAVVIAASQGRTVHIDVVVWSRAGAVWFGGSDGGDRYDEDPEASVFERIKVKADSLGRVP